MFQCRRFYTDKNFKNRIITNSYSLRKLRYNNKTDDSENKNIINIPQKNNINIKRLNTSNSTEKKIINKENNDEKMREKLQQKRESSLRARKMIITRIKNSKDSMEEKKDNGKNENIRKIEIKIKEEYKNYKRADSYNDIRTRFNLKKNLEKNKYLNENSNNKNPIDTFGINYKNKGKIDNTKIMSNNQKNNYLLNKNIRHIYKKNIIKTTTLKHTKVLNFERKNDFKKNDNINKKNKEIFKMIYKNSRSFQNNKENIYNNIFV